MADPRDRPLGHDPDRVTGKIELRSDGHEADVAAVEPFPEEIEINREEVVDREGPCGLGVQKRPLEVQPETEGVGRLDGSLRGLKIPRNPCSDQGFWRVDM